MTPQGSISIKYKRLDDSAIPFKYIRENDACMDMYSLVETVIPPHETQIIPTGIALEIPHGWEGIVRGRSGMAAKGINTHVGTVESDYRGDVGVVLTNTTDKPFTINKSMRIAQFTIKPVYRIKLQEATTLTDTERGENGYGSSGY